MQLQINGETVELEPGTTLQSYLEQSPYSLLRIAVERNGEIVPKAQYGQTILSPGDVVEVVSFVGGG